jgi:uncharacterized membrane protein
MDTQIYLLGALLIIIVAMPIFIYLYYFREPKIDYNAKYETDLPTDDPPAIVNAVCAGDPEKMGVPNLDGFRATILDLIDRNYLFLKNKSDDGTNYSKCLLLEINQGNDLSTLRKFEVQVLEFLRKCEDNGTISLDLVSEGMNHVETGGCSQCTYKEWRDKFDSNISAYKDWKCEVKSTLLEGNNFKDAFYNRGNKSLKIFGVLGTIAAWSIIFYSFPSDLFSQTVILCALILFLESIILFFIPERAIDKWTPYGLEYYERWMNFKRYIEDFSLIKEYPPESVKIWDKYMVYATALGAAKGVKKTMELLLPETELRESDIYCYHDYENQKS